ncbi:MAG: carbon-nitrogen hydrolase family protein [Chloroflexi bacterium]|nr:carbon-nitrogen hydrolase family protein [Chloroflexota bacterium]
MPIPEAYRRYETRVKLACVTFHAAWGDKATNLARMEASTEEAAQAGNQFIVFPELCVTGFECPEPCAMHGEQAEPVPGPTTERVHSWAARHDVYIAFSLPERDTAQPAKLYISSILVGPEGLVGVYRKLSFASRSARCFSAGDAVPVFDTRYGPVGLQVCSNFSMFPEISRIQALKGARLIINTTASLSGPGQPYFLLQQTGARSTENAVYCASANLTGTDITMSYYGHSVITGPDPPRAVEVLARGDEKEGIISAELDFESLHQARTRHTYPYGFPMDVFLREYQAVAKCQDLRQIFPASPVLVQAAPAKR